MPAPAKPAGIEKKSPLLADATTPEVLVSGVILAIEPDGSLAIKRLVSPVAVFATMRTPDEILPTGVAELL